MKLQATEWFPDTVLPVREGDYEVVEWPPKMLTPPPQDDAEILLATFCTKYGQTGFWLKLESTSEEGGKSISYRLLKVLKWRGRLRIERVKLWWQEGAEPGEQLPLDLPQKRHRVQLAAA